MLADVVVRVWNRGAVCVGDDQPGTEVVHVVIDTTDAPEAKRSLQARLDDGDTFDVSAVPVIRVASGHECSRIMSRRRRLIVDQ